MNERTEQIEIPPEYIRQFPNQAVQVETELAEQILRAGGAMSHVMLRLADQVHGQASALSLLAERVQELEDAATTPAIESRVLSFDDVEPPTLTPVPVIERTRTTQEVADALGASVSHVSHMVREGGLPADNLGARRGRRFNMTEVITYLRQNPEVMGRKKNPILRRIG